jgi:hypothetical protein
MTASKRSFLSSLAFMPSPLPPDASGGQPAPDIIARPACKHHPASWSNALRKAT